MHAVPLIFSRLTQYATVWSHLNLFLLVLFAFCLLFLLLYLGQKYFNSNLKVSHWKTKDEEVRIFMEDFVLFALDINRLVALLCHRLVYFIAVVAEF